MTATSLRTRSRSPGGAGGTGSTSCRDSHLDRSLARAAEDSCSCSEAGECREFQVWSAACEGDCRRWIAWQGFEAAEVAECGVGDGRSAAAGRSGADEVKLLLEMGNSMLMCL